MKITIISSSISLQKLPCYCNVILRSIRIVQFYIYITKQGIKKEVAFDKFSTRFSRNFESNVIPSSFFFCFQFTRRIIRFAIGPPSPCAIGTASTLLKSSIQDIEPHLRH